jgi:aspartyl-tRNA(Asn)/glutamyl-tRNA(Gln) amidotransferase subunit C
MGLTDEQMTHVARLARLGLTEEERERFRRQLDTVLEHIDRLNAVDTSSVPATAQVGNLVNVWREDVAEPSLSVAQALANAPERESDFFRVGAIQE